MHLFVCLSNYLPVYPYTGEICFKELAVMIKETGKSKICKEGAVGSRRLESRKELMSLESEAQRGEVTCQRAHSGKKSSQNMNPGHFFSSQPKPLITNVDGLYNTGLLL